MRRPPRPPAAPLITRRSTLGFGIAFFASGLSYSLLFPASDRGAGPLGVAAAAALGVAVVTCAVVWVSGAVLAARRQSYVWLVVAIVLGPFGSLACALLMDGTAAAPPS